MRNYRTVIIISVSSWLLLCCARASAEPITFQWIKDSRVCADGEKWLYKKNLLGKDLLQAFEVLAKDESLTLIDKLHFLNWSISSAVLEKYRAFHLEALSELAFLVYTDRYPDERKKMQDALDVLFRKPADKEKTRAVLSDINTRHAIMEAAMTRKLIEISGETDAERKARLRDPFLEYRPNCYDETVNADLNAQFSAIAALQVIISASAYTNATVEKPLDAKPGLYADATNKVAEMIYCLPDPAVERMRLLFVTWYWAAGYMGPDEKELFRKFYEGEFIDPEKLRRVLDEENRRRVEAAGG